MNAAEWQAVAKRIVADTLAVVGEFLADPSLESFDAALRSRYRAAGQARDPEALRQVCLEMRAAAYARMLGRGQGRN